MRKTQLQFHSRHQAGGTMAAVTVNVLWVLHRCVWTYSLILGAEHRHRHCGHQNWALTVVQLRESWEVEREKGSNRKNKRSRKIQREGNFTHFYVTAQHICMHLTRNILPSHTKSFFSSCKTSVSNGELDGNSAEDLVVLSSSGTN